MDWVLPFLTVPTVGTARKGMGTYNKDMLFTGPMVSAPGLTGIAWFMSAVNTTAPAQGAGTLNAFISFYEFDREQVRKFPLNTPVPVRSR